MPIASSQAKKRFGKKLIVRCGYLHSRFTELLGYDDKAVVKAKEIEHRAFEAADLGVVATNRDMKWVVETHNIPMEKIRVIPNYVDVDTFMPSGDQMNVQFDIVYVGRAGPQKNLPTLLEALGILKMLGRHIRLLLIGGCATDQKLKSMVEEERLEVAFLENVLNSKLPYYLCQAFNAPELTFINKAKTHFI